MIVDPMLPEHMQGAMKRYLENGIEPGGFLYAILTNDLKGAVTRADHINIKLIPEIVSYCVSEIPASAWGSVAKVEGWLWQLRPDDDMDDDEPETAPGEDAFEEGYF